MCAPDDPAATAEPGAPYFTAVVEVTVEELAASGEDITRRGIPVIIRGALNTWPAATAWSFEHLAQNAGSATGSFYQGGPAEQGMTLEPAVLPVAPYLRRLATHAAASSGEALVIPIASADGARCWALNWRFSLTPRDLYLAQWSILEPAPQLAGDLRIRSLWVSWWRLIYTHVFIGPAGTVSGLHTDWNPNFFCSVRGTKDWILFPPSEDEALQPSSKYDYGATCSNVNLSKLQAMPADVKAAFQKAKGGLYVRVEPGDALYVPPHTWHAVVSITPAISLSIFGLQMRHVLVNGIPMMAGWILHRLGLYRRGNCTCCLNRGAEKSD